MHGPTVVRVPRKVWRVVMLVMFILSFVAMMSGQFVGGLICSLAFGGALVLDVMRERKRTDHELRALGAAAMSAQQETEIRHKLESSPDQMAEILVECYRKAFSADVFHSYFDSRSLEGQNFDTALAEWHALGTFSYTFCLWNVLGTKERVFPILDVFQPSLLNALNLNENTKRHFLEIAIEREEDYMSKYGELGKDSSSWARFFGRVVSRITGRFDEASGIQIASAATVAALSHYHTTVMIKTKELMESLSQ